MHLRAQPPVMVPSEHWQELEKLSKCALMDVVWDYATRGLGEENGPDAIMGDIRDIAKTITTFRAKCKQ